MKLEVRIHTDFHNGFFELTKENVELLLKTANELQNSQIEEDDEDD